MELRISELKLRIPGTALQHLVDNLYAELDARGLRFHPPCYLSDEWGCPEGRPLIAIPFYLAHPELERIEEAMGGDLESTAQITMYLRHEAGHAFNYAYRLHESRHWQQVFGSYARPYLEHYQPVPFSRRFVRHLPGWYAQKHPDEDFAETFAVWLTPGLDWERAYRDWPALEKLRYVDALMRALPGQPLVAPCLEAGMLSVDEMHYTVREHYQRQERHCVSLSLGRLLDDELKDVFGPARTPGRPAHAWLMQRRPELVREVSHWSGVHPHVLQALVDHLVERAAVLGLTVTKESEDAVLIRAVTMVTTLAANHLFRDRFVDI